MPHSIFQYRSLVICGESGLALLVTNEDILHFSGEGFSESVLVLLASLGAEVRTLQDEASDADGSAQGVVNYDHAAEGVAENVDGAGHKAVSNLGELVNEAVDMPQVGVIGTVGLAAAELVVEDDWPVRAESLKGLKLPVGDAGAAVDDDEGRCVRAVNLATVDASAGDGYEGFGGC